MAKETGGFYRESEIITHLNNEKIKSINKDLRNVIQSMFGPLKDNTILHSERVMGFVKPDFSITANGITKYVSMKSGTASVVHQEDIKTFVKFLRECGVSRRTLQTFLYLHYGDGTLDGSGPKRYSADEMKIIAKERIKDANDELNNNKEIILKVARRVLFKGTIEGPEADYIFHGDVSGGYIASRGQIYKYITRHDWNDDELRTLHIGPFFFRCHVRYLNTEVKNPEKRQRCDCWWPRIKTDIMWHISKYSDSYDEYLKSLDFLL